MARRPTLLVAVLLCAAAMSACSKDYAGLLRQAMQMQAAAAKPVAEPQEPPQKLSTVEIKPIESLVQDGLHDMHNDAAVALQDPTAAMADFPKDRRLQIDWVRTLEQGLINPRADLRGEGDMLVMDMDIIMKNTAYMPWVRFPHLAHTRWLHCSNCHPRIFLPQEGANAIEMNKVLRGQFCGVCHDKVAFSLFVCERCHSIPHENSPPKWW